MDESRRKRFLWGVLLAWLPSIPFVIGLAASFKGFSEQRATGLGAVAGGFAEIFAAFGFALAFLFEVGAIVLLIRAFSGENRLRAFFSVVSIGVSVLMLFLFGLILWLFLVESRHYS